MRAEVAITLNVPGCAYVLCSSSPTEEASGSDPVQSGFESLGEYLGSDQTWLAADAESDTACGVERPTSRPKTISHMPSSSNGKTRASYPLNVGSIPAVGSQPGSPQRYQASGPLEKRLTHQVLTLEASVQIRDGSLNPREERPVRALRLFLAVVLVLTMVIPGAQMASAGTGGWCQGLHTGAPVMDALGDSLTEGGSVSDPAQRWTSELGASFRSDGAPGTQVWTGGAIPGSATADYVSGAKYSGHIEFTSHQPNLITLAWGTNDWAGNVSPAVFKAQYQQIIDRIKALSPDSTVLIIHMPWVYNQSLTSTRGDQADYLEAEKELAHENGAWFLGAEWFFQGNDPFILKTSDGVHMTALGQWVFYSAIRSFLLGMC